MKDNDIQIIGESLISRDYASFESLMAKHIISDCQNNSKHNITWTRNFPNGGLPYFMYDLFGKDLSTGGNIYVEIKAKSDRKTILMTVNQFRKTRRVGLVNDLYLLVVFDVGESKIKCYDLSLLVKSNKVEIGEEITNAIANAKETISAFLGEVQEGEKPVEVVGDASIPNVAKKNWWPIIVKASSIFVALSFLLAVFLLDFFGQYKLSSERLVLVGMFEVVCLLAFIKEIKVGNVYIATVNAKDK